MNEFNLPQSNTDQVSSKKKLLWAVAIIVIVLLVAAFVVKKMGVKKIMTEDDMFNSMRTSETSTLSPEDMAALEVSMASDGQNRITPAQLEELKESMKSQ